MRAVNSLHNAAHIIPRILDEIVLNFFFRFISCLYWISYIACSSRSHGAHTFTHSHITHTSNKFNERRESWFIWEKERKRKSNDNNNNNNTKEWKWKEHKLNFNAS